MTKLSAFFIGFSAFIVFLLFQYFYQGNPNSIDQKKNFEIFAHRGAHVMWKKGTYSRATGCEATHIYKPTLTQKYIENTLESIGKAFELGATIVEIDIRRSKDNQLVIFHDYDLSCRTDGEGYVSDHDLAYLKTLDIGYGYTPDEGKTFPYRGKGLGKMPTLQEVLNKFPNKKFLIDHKDRSQKTAELLVCILKKLSSEQKSKIYYWRSPEIYDYIKGELPPVNRFFPTRPEIKECLMPYILSTGILNFSEKYRGLNIGLNKKFKIFLGMAIQVPQESTTK